VLGVLASLGLTRLVRSQLFGLEATDPATFVGASVVPLASAAPTCALPARRAAAVDAVDAVDAVVASREE
jgi:ABC-type lipoprotein release transport system permease subunit